MFIIWCTWSAVAGLGYFLTNTLVSIRPHYLMSSGLYHVPSGRQFHYWILTWAFPRQTINYQVLCEIWIFYSADVLYLKLPATQNLRRVQADIHSALIEATCRINKVSTWVVLIAILKASSYNLKNSMRLAFSIDFPIDTRIPLIGEEEGDCAASFLTYLPTILTLSNLEYF